MKSDQLPLISKAASIIRDLIGCEFDWDTPSYNYQYGKESLFILIHEAGSVLRPYCNYDCEDYDKINKMVDALDAIGLFVEDCTGDYSGVYEVSK
jgi:hypothetical protein